MPPKLPAPLERRLPTATDQVDPDWLLERFLDYTEEIGVEMYPAQEEAVLEIFGGSSVILNTPTGSGKSLVALAACYKALCEKRFAFYTAPIKALVSEKFFELCELLGPDNVGMMTGDASVNRDAPVICCTAEILANLALREGERAQADWVVMDEFHYYSDPDRGAAWQLPLLALPQARFLLMSATLGETDFFLKEIRRHTGKPACLVKSTDRPVPLDWEYSQKPLQQKIQELAESGLTPIYVVHFSQRAASEQAQNLMSLNFLSKEEKRSIKDELSGFRFDSPFGKELARFIPHGVGVHHAGMLPKYRRLVERLARKGLLRIICGTDTLGVGVNVPIRCVLFTQLCKFDGSGTAILSVRDFQQIAGRAGRKGFDSRGSVIVQAPEHEIENKTLKDKAAGDAKKLRRLKMRKPPEWGYAPWNEETLNRLRDSNPEALKSQFKVSHGMLLNVLAEDDNCRRARNLIQSCHEREGDKRRLLKQGGEMFRSLLSSGILQLDKTGLRVNTDLQQDFSLNQALSLYAVEVFDSLDETAADYPLVLLSVLESILESPSVILNRQVAKLKTIKMAELKAAGVEYEERLEELDKVEYNKPEAEFIYESFNLFAKHHPWVAGFSISPKSIVRDMHESASSFNVYVKDYGLARAEGVLLRYMTDAYRTLRQTVPEAKKTEEVWDLEHWLGAELRSIDASLIEEWERLQDPEQAATPADQAAPPPEDLLSNLKAFRILVRNGAWRLVAALARRDSEYAIEALQSVAKSGAKFPVDGQGDAWTPERLNAQMAPFFSEYEALLISADARSASRAQLQEESDASWRLEQTLTDPEDHLEWCARFDVLLEESREANRPVLVLTALGPANS